MKKKFIALFLGICILLTCTVPVLASQAQAELLKIYGDDMLFEQEKDAVFAGKAPAGSTVSAELFAADGSLAASAETVTDEKGEFTVSFAAPKGSFEEYTVILKCNGTEFDTLNRVVFGELWLASGQSNMQYPLSQALSAIEDFENGAKQSKWIRAMVSDTYSAHGKVSVTPHGDIPDAASSRLGFRSSASIVPDTSNDNMMSIPSVLEFCQLLLTWGRASPTIRNVKHINLSKKGRCNKCTR